MSALIDFGDLAIRGDLILGIRAKVNGTEIVSATPFTGVMETKMPYADALKLIAKDVDVCSN